MGTESPLMASGSATVGADGRATVTVQPLRAFETWHVTKITVNNNGSVLVPAARVYRGFESPTALVEGSYSGTLDSSDTNIMLETGESLICVWEGRVVGTAGADVGSVCTFILNGTRKNGV